MLAAAQYSSQGLLQNVTEMANWHRYAYLKVSLARLCLSKRIYERLLCNLDKMNRMFKDNKELSDRSFHIFICKPDPLGWPSDQTTYFIGMFNNDDIATEHVSIQLIMGANNKSIMASTKIRKESVVQVKK
jgi:hypothetical protein